MGSSLKQIHSILTRLCFEQSLEQVAPAEYVYHVSHPDNRISILANGLEPRLGKNIWDIEDGYKPAVYVTTSVSNGDLFYDNYDNDVWQISTNGLSNKFYLDGNYVGRSNLHLVTYDRIPSNFLKLIYKGSGIDLEDESDELDKFKDTEQYKNRYNR